VPDVVADVEVRIIHPERATQLERHETHALPVARHAVQLRRDHLDDLVVAGRRTLEDPHRRDVHVADFVLDVQEHGVLRTHAIHVSAPPIPPIPSLACAPRQKTNALKRPEEGELGPGPH
jgi:hypothetical protein